MGRRSCLPLPSASASFYLQRWWRKSPKNCWIQWCMVPSTSHRLPCCDCIVWCHLDLHWKFSGNEGQERETEVVWEGVLVVWKEMAPPSIWFWRDCQGRGGLLKRQRQTWQRLEIFECCGQSVRQLLTMGTYQKTKTELPVVGNSSELRKLKKKKKTLFGGRNL